MVVQSSFLLYSGCLGAGAAASGPRQPREVVIRLRVLYDLSLAGVYNPVVDLIKHSVIKTEGCLYDNLVLLGMWIRSTTFGPSALLT